MATQVLAEEELTRLRGSRRSAGRSAEPFFGEGTRRRSSKIRARISAGVDEVHDRSTGWFVITSTAVLLVEAKGIRSTEAVRQAIDSVDETLSRLLLHFLNKIRPKT